MLPDGWKKLSDWCIAKGDYTVCKIGGLNGWSYELWHLKNQLVVGLRSAEDAIRECERQATTLSNSAQAAGATSMPLPDGAQQSQLSFIEAS